MNHSRKNGEQSHQGYEAESTVKPSAPTHLEKRSWKYIFRRTISEFTRDQCTDAAATLTYYAILAMFPALVATFSLLGMVGQNDEAAKAVLDIIGEVAPGDTAETLRGPIEQLSRAPGAGIALIVGILVALWSASGYVRAFTRAMNSVYDTAEGRPFWKLLPFQLLLTLIAIISFGIAALVLVLSGDMVEAVGNMIGASAELQMVWNIAKWPLLVFVVVFLVAMLYYATPNVKQPRFRWISPGAFLSIVVLAIASVGFGFYVTNFSNYDRTYGSLAGVVIFLLWVWIANLALLFGAEFDAEFERGRQLQGGLVAEQEIQLPPRDDRQTTKREKKEREIEAEGRRIRSNAEDEPSNRSL